MAAPIQPDERQSSRRRLILGCRAAALLLLGFAVPGGLTTLAMQLSAAASLSHSLHQFAPTDPVPIRTILADLLNPSIVWSIGLSMASWALATAAGGYLLLRDGARLFPPPRPRSLP